ncbi:lysine transporter LysE [Methanosarcina sp. 2.H.T.1A.6]|uniref:LysE family translocator n=1 Tax=unclassified Methanosarcina TaxID=2644672 RepID=UPI000620ED16|nr:MULTISPECIES: LysE family translocator [unclassified Methanosarcina]KKG16069.1 lysine transporter LysE [Methanosarcina sp. 2.H.T.1A.3]KKG20912.1 lysine transporter LysE [Methanosarcina sp. 2.H.T.1A.8]KKG24303.1 lysine transporter LysE [Methanosarcina sp. 2.H.T.1A.6]KKG27968.1 lysine transporter LysE [Methanosarcina sp. 2.H.T.1A.15]
MSDVVEFLALGAFLGLAAGTSPGPLLAITISETLQHGKWEGIKVAISPLITDLPIILSVLFVLSHLTGYNSIIGIIALFGASYLIHSGIESLKIKKDSVELNFEKKDALKKGVIVNFGNPHPYVFWLSIGGPIILKSLNTHIWAIILFIAGFYIFLVGSKVIVALIVEKSKHFINSKYYFSIIRVLGIAQIVFGLTFIKVGLDSLNVI